MSDSTNPGSGSRDSDAMDAFLEMIRADDDGMALHEDRPIAAEARDKLWAQFNEVEHAASGLESGATATCPTKIEGD